MNVLSLFDGMSCGRIALERAGIPVTNYYASEIDKNAIQVSNDNWGESVQHLGDIKKIHITNWGIEVDGNHSNMRIIDEKIDLIIGGSPCQGFSFAGKQLNFEDPRSQLFFEYVRLLNQIRLKNPNVKFLLENVKMKKEYQKVISELLGVESIEINSSLVSAQNRKRLYWTNIEGFVMPEDKNILLKDIVLEDAFPVSLHNIYGGFKEETVRVFEDKSPTIRANSGGGSIPSFVKKNLIHSEKALAYMDREVSGGRSHWDFRHHSDINNPKSSAVVANFFKGVPYNVFKDWDCIRKFHPVECERLQTVPDNYTKGVSNTQRYKMLGNGWTVDVIVEFFKHLQSKPIAPALTGFENDEEF